MPLEHFCAAIWAAFAAHYFRFASNFSSSFCSARLFIIVAPLLTVLPFSPSSAASAVFGAWTLVSLARNSHQMRYNFAISLFLVFHWYWIYVRDYADLWIISNAFLRRSMRERAVHALRWGSWGTIRAENEKKKTAFSKVLTRKYFSSND